VLCAALEARGRAPLTIEATTRWDCDSEDPRALRRRLEYFLREFTATYEFVPDSSVLDDFLQKNLRPSEVRLSPCRGRPDHKLVTRFDRAQTWCPVYYSVSRVGFNRRLDQALVLVSRSVSSGSPGMGLGANGEGSFILLVREAEEWHIKGEVLAFWWIS
jgi:hypothetical protein